MDAEQFTQLIKAITDNKERLLNAVISNQQGSSNQQATTHLHTSASINNQFIQNFDQLNSDKENFSQYIERFENYIQLKNVSGD